MPEVKKNVGVKKSTDNPRLHHPKTLIEFTKSEMDLKSRIMRSDLHMMNSQNL